MFTKHEFKLETFVAVLWSYDNCVMFWPFDPAKNAIQGDAPEGIDTF